MKKSIFMVCLLCLFALATSNAFASRAVKLKVKRHINLGAIQYTSPISIQVDDASSNINNLNTRGKSKSLGIISIQGEPLDLVDIYLPDSVIIGSGIKATYIRVVGGKKIQLDERGTAEVLVALNLELSNISGSTSFSGFIPIELNGINSNSNSRTELKIGGSVRVISALMVSDTIDFGTIHVNANEACKATVSPKQNFSTTCPLATGTPKRAEFVIQNLLSTPVLVFPSSVYLSSTSKEESKVSVSNFKYYFVNTQDNKYTFYIGGTLNLPANVNLGDYAGRMKVIIQY